MHLAVKSPRQWTAVRVKPYCSLSLHGNGEAYGPHVLFSVFEALTRSMGIRPCGCGPVPSSRAYQYVDTVAIKLFKNQSRFTLWRWDLMEPKRCDQLTNPGYS